MKTDPRLSEFLLDPSVKKPLKVDGLTGACKKLGFSDLTKNLLLAMADNNRVSYIDAVAGSYATLIGRPQGGGGLHRHHCQAPGCRYGEGGRGSSEGIPQGQREGIDQLRCRPCYCWWNGRVHRRQVLRHEHE